MNLTLIKRALNAAWLSLWYSVIAHPEFEELVDSGDITDPKVIEFATEMQYDYADCNALMLVDQAVKELDKS